MSYKRAPPVCFFVVTKQ